MKTLLLDLQHSIAQAPEHPHCHLSCEMVYVKKGKARFTINGADYTAGPGSLVILSTLEEHTVRVLAQPYDRYFAIISLPELSRAFGPSLLTQVFKNRPRGFSHLVTLRAQKAEADNLFERLHDEYAHNLPCSRQMVESLLTQLLVLACRACPDNFSATLTPTAERVLAAQQYIEDHFTEDLSVADLANRFFISSCHLTHSFKEQVGYSPKQYMRLLRLSLAKELLETTSLPVSAIAVRTGFADTNNFIRAFRQQYAVSPGKWRKT